MHDHEIRLIWPMFWALFGLSFWVVPEFMRHQARMKKIEVMKSLAEKGVAIPPELAAAFAPQPRRERLPAHDVRVGLVLIAGAAAFAVLASILIFVMQKPAWPVYGVAAFPGLIGLVYLGLGLTKTKA